MAFALTLSKSVKKSRVQAYGIVGGELRWQGHMVRQIAGDSLGENADRNFINNDRCPPWAAKARQRFS